MGINVRPPSDPPISQTRAEVERPVGRSSKYAEPVARVGDGASGDKGRPRVGGRIVAEDVVKDTCGGRCWCHWNACTQARTQSLSTAETLDVRRLPPCHFRVGTPTKLNMSSVSPFIKRNEHKSFLLIFIFRVISFC
jgi:hypothetical protein